MLPAWDIYTKDSTLKHLQWFTAEVSLTSQPGFRGNRYAIGDLCVSVACAGLIML